MASWLKAFGKEVLKIFGVVVGIGQKVLPAVQEAATIAEAVLPQYAPLIAEGADVVTAAAKYISWLNGAASSFVAGSSLDQRMAAITAFVSQGVQSWFAANFPGSAEVSDKTMFQRGISLVGRGVSDVIASVESTAKIAKASAAALGADVLSQIAKLVQWAEFTAPTLIGDTKSGPQKAQAISASVDSIIRAWVTDVLGTAVSDTTKYRVGVNEIQQGVVDILNSLAPAVTTKQTVILAPTKA